MLSSRLRIGASLVAALSSCVGAACGGDGNLLGVAGGRDSSLGHDSGGSTTGDVDGAGNPGPAADAGGSSSGGGPGSGIDAGGSGADGCTSPCGSSDDAATGGDVPSTGNDAMAPDGSTGSCGSSARACCPPFLNRPQCNTPQLMCCTGVPYPDGGVCMTSCPLDSDFHLKRDFEPVNVDSVLHEVATIPITTWRYHTEGPDVRHMGPMAQEFHGAFGLGDSERQIHPVDGIGVSLAAIQALSRAVDQLREDNRDLRNENARITRELDDLRARVDWR